MQPSFTILKQQNKSQSPSQKRFIESPPFTIWDDIKIIFERDPAANNWFEVLLCYPGVHALALHRVSHWFWQKQVPILPRFLSHLGRFL
ncbi:MAG: serine O-acetyltransferase, partial [Halothece sp. Uz-M2-17]|nr:serine O-acetyltransferase [Halothece sp. Uz-M2-17]